MLAGPQALGKVTNGWSLIPAQTVSVLSALPGLLINVVFGGIMIGKRLPSVRRIWNDAAPHAILGGVFSFGQFARARCHPTKVMSPTTSSSARSVVASVPHLVERRTVNDITGLSLDILVAAAIGRLSLTTLGENVPSILILTALSVAWSVTGLLWLGPHWFDLGIADYGQSQGNVATGFILAEMADPAHTTRAAVGYGYKQLFYEPFLGGGILTALSVPLILSIGSLTFGIAAAAATVGLIIWGVARNRHARPRAGQ